MPTTTRALKTYADYAALEEGAPYQLINGELVMSPAPSRKHQEVLLDLAILLKAFVDARGLGKVYVAPFDVKFSDIDVYQPDVVFVSQDRLHILTDQLADGAPDLVVEILSPSTGYYDLTHKRRVYEAAGVTEYWIIDPMERTVEVLALADGAYTRADAARGDGQVASRLLDGFAVDLETLFAA